MAALLGAAFASSDPVDRRTTFVQRLREQFQPYGLRVLSADLGQDRQGHVWVLALQLPDQRVQTLHVGIAQGQDPLSDATCDDVVRRVVRHLQRR